MPAASTLPAFVIASGIETFLPGATAAGNVPNEPVRSTNGAAMLTVASDASTPPVTPAPLVVAMR